jgi:Acidobacterial duplicated orphan permease
MRWLDQARKSTATLFRRERETARLDEEMRFHLEQEEAERVARGATPGEARRSARLEFGNPAMLREEARRVWNWGWLERMARDVRFAARGLRRSPGFTVTVIAVMALCIGATTALFTVVRAVLLRPLPFRDPSKLVMVWEHFRSNNSESPYNPVAAGDFYLWRAKTHGFENMAAIRGWSFNLSDDRGALPEVVEARAGSWNLFRVLDVAPVVGRGFTEEEDGVGRAPVAMLTWSLFQRRFQGDRSIVGKQIQLDGKPYTIVGVLPEWFSYPDPRVQLWVPYAATFTAETILENDNHGSSVVARLRPDVSEKTAIGEVAALQYRIHMDHLNSPVAEDALVQPMIDDVVGDVKKPLLTMMAAVGCMLLIGCLNVANLLVARSAARQKEMAIRGALGAGRLALVREQMTETILLCAAGGGLGLLLAMAGTRWLASNWHGLPRTETIHIDGVVVLFSLGVVCLCAVLAGLLPALSATNKSVLGALQDTARTVSGGLSRAWLRKALLTAEVALTVVLLLAAGLLLKSFVRLRTTDLGSATENVLTMGYSLPKSQYDKPEQRVAFAETLLERVRRLPGVRAAGLGNVAPGAGWGGDRVFIIPGHPMDANSDMAHRPDAQTRLADPGYFDALQIPLIAGRVFDSHDRLENAKKVIISQELAKRYFPGENPLQKQIIMGTDPANQKRMYEVIGVVGDTLWRVGRQVKATTYFPVFEGEQGYRMTLVVRTDGDPLKMALPIQKEIAAIDPRLPVVDVLTIPQIVGESTVNQSFSASLVLAFAVLSLLLAGVGLYGVLSYVVTQRVTEIGIRIALGAQKGQVLGLVLRDGLRPVALGLVIGVAGGAAVGYVIRSLLYGTQPMDPAVFAAMVTTLLLVAAMASAAPAWRASSVNPIEALRAE